MKQIDFVSGGNNFVVKLNESYSFSENSVETTLFKQKKFRKQIQFSCMFLSCHVRISE